MKTRNERDAIIARAMEEAGQRLTRQKVEVYHFMQDNGMYHPTAEDVYFGVKKSVPSISLGTVYNCLESLVDCRLLNRFNISGSPTHHYEMKTRDHHHFRCLSCGKIIDVESKHLEPGELVPGPEFRVTEVQLQLTGYCPECSSKDGENFKKREG